MPSVLSDTARASRRADMAVVGAGIVGLAHALEAARRGLSVVLFERNARAVGASIRNFGMIVPLATAPGREHDQAVRSKRVWMEAAAEAGFRINPGGALVLAYREDERAVMLEFLAQASSRRYRCSWLGPAEVLLRCPAVRGEGLQGGLWTPDAAIIDPQEALARLTAFLARRYKVKVCFGTAVTHVAAPYLVAGGKQWRADRVVICSGSDLETLYPGVLAGSGLTRCKLQMMRTVPQPAGWTLGPLLATGLSLCRYSAFGACPSLPSLMRRIGRGCPELARWGIHVLVAQNASGELVIGDSHEYGLEANPFDRPEIDALILRHLRSFLAPPSLELSRRWHGIYAQHEKESDYVAAPEPHVRIVTGLGGSGMTRSFGLAQEVMADWLGASTARRSVFGAARTQALQPAEDA